MQLRDKLRIFAAAAMIFALPCAGVSAADIIYDSEECALAISGTADGGAAYIIFPAEISPESIDADAVNSGRIITDKIECSNGGFNTKVLFPENFESGWYKVFVDESDEPGSFIHISHNIKTDINSANAGEYITKICEDIGIDSKEVSGKLSFLTEYMLKNMPQEGYSASDFADRLVEGLVIAEADNINEQYLEKYYANLGINSADKMSAMSENKIEAMRKLLKKNLSAASDFTKTYKQCMLLADINIADAAGLKQLLQQNAEEIKLDANKFSKLENEYKKSQVFEYMYSKRSFYYSYKEVCDAFAEAVDYVSKQGATANTGSSSSGGGSGAQSSGAVYSPAEKALKDEFDDLGSVEWARQYINTLAQKKIISGYGDNRFGPNDNVTRGQFIKILTGTFGIGGGYAENLPFDDVPKGHIFRDCITAAYNEGIVSGISEEMFGTDNAITREDACVLLYRTFEKMGYTEKNDAAAEFEDYNAISAYAKEAVSELCGMKIVKGDGVNFNPKNSITRAETAVMICIAMEKAK